jgi:hypothetical protein
MVMQRRNAMKNLTLIMAGAAALAFGASGASAGDSLRGEEKLAKMLEGRVAGEPVRCISTLRNNSSIIDNTAMVFDEGKTIYVARPMHPEGLDPFDVLVIKRFSSSRLCTNDQMHTIDRTGGYFTGIVFLEEFVPYTKAG